MSSEEEEFGVFRVLVAVSSVEIVTADFGLSGLYMAMCMLAMAVCITDYVYN